MSSFLGSWLLAFAFTQMVEMGVYAQAHDRPRPRPERLAIAFACSGITHPIVWFVMPEVAAAIGLHGYWSGVALAETFAVLAEAALLACFQVRRPLGWSLFANASSVALGLFGYVYLRWTP